MILAIWNRIRGVADADRVAFACRLEKGNFLKENFESNFDAGVGLLMKMLRTTEATDIEIVIKNYVSLTWFQLQIGKKNAKLLLWMLQGDHAINVYIKVLIMSVAEISSSTAAAAAAGSTSSLQPHANGNCFIKGQYHSV